MNRAETEPDASIPRVFDVLSDAQTDLLRVLLRLSLVEDRLPSPVSAELRWLLGTVNIRLGEMIRLHSHPKAGSLESA